MQTKRHAGWQYVKDRFASFLAVKIILKPCLKDPRLKFVRRVRHGDKAEKETGMRDEERCGGNEIGVPLGGNNLFKAIRVARLSSRLVIALRFSRLPSRRSSLHLSGNNNRRVLFRLRRTQIDATVVDLESGSGELHFIIRGNEVYRVDCVIQRSTLSGSVVHAITLQLFFSRTRALVSSFSIRIVAWFLSSRPRVCSSPFPRSRRLAHLAKRLGPVIPHDLCLGEVTEVRGTGSVCTAS
ncbi:hypothetical protein PUN28_012838 [Cardiocondyla obscurior]|uniref:Uncharacterized protein n=1 Tax=Cardiocondyla obscurior TaxID=286306 RepID=A0AAW2F8I8_9HYME